MEMHHFMAWCLVKQKVIMVW